MAHIFLKLQLLSLEHLLHTSGRGRSPEQSEEAVVSGAQHWEGGERHVSSALSLRLIQEGG